MSAREKPPGVNKLAAKTNNMSLIELQTYIVEGDNWIQKDVIDHAHAWWDDPPHTQEGNKCNC